MGPAKLVRYPLKKTFSLVLLLYLLNGVSIRAIPPKGTAPSSEYRLIHDLLAGYDSLVRPRYNSSEVVDVHIRFSLQQIYDLDEKRQILTISGWLTAEWTDEFLMWDPEDYEGLQTVMISPRKIWTPKLAIGNSATRMFQEWKYFWLTIRHNGQCRWQPGGNFAFTCALDMNYYPFDEQTCTMEIETWFYTADKVHLKKSMSEFGLETYLQHGEWTVIGTEVTQTDRVYGYYKNEAFPEVYFTIHLRRKYTFYFMYIFLPCIMLSFVLLMVFVLPAESGEKISLGVSILVAFSLFLLIVAEQVPDTSDAVPIVAIYLMYFMMATAISVMTSTLVLKLHHHGLDKPPSKWLRSFMFETLAPLLCLNNVIRWSREQDKCETRSEEREMTVDDPAKRGLSATYSKADCNGLKADQAPDSEEVRTLERTLSLQCIRPPSSGGGDGGGGGSGGGECSTAPRRPPQRKCSTGQEPVRNENGTLTAGDRQSVSKLEEWRNIGIILDRLFFWMFLFVIILPLVSLIGFVRVFALNA